MLSPASLVQIPNIPVINTRASNPNSAIVQRSFLPVKPIGQLLCQSNAGLIRSQAARQRSNIYPAVLSSMSSIQSAQMMRTVLVERTIVPQQGQTQRRLLDFVGVAVGTSPPLAVRLPPGT